MYRRQHPSDKPSSAAHSLFRDTCIAASPSQTVIAVFKRFAYTIAPGFTVPCRSTRRMIRSKMSDATRSLELARSYSDVIPNDIRPCPSVFVTEISSLKMSVPVSPGRRFCTPQLHSRGGAAAYSSLSLALRPLSSALATWARPISSAHE